MTLRCVPLLIPLLFLGFAGACTPPPPPAGSAPAPSPVDSRVGGPDRDYLVYVASEATDRIALIRFGPGGARVEQQTTIGVMLADPDGPHGIAVSPDGRHWYATTAHGTPYGSLWKYETGSNAAVGRVMLGDFPATAHVTPDGAFVFVANFNLHGEMVPSSVSVVAADAMVEVARIQTCTMPHGSRINRDGTRHYSACMMDDMVIEIDTRTLGVARHFMLKPGSEHGMAGAPGGGQHRTDAGSDHGAGHGSGGSHANVSCSPTWAQPSADGSRVYVACNKSDEIVEMDVESWTMTRRLPAGPGVYNLAVTRDGRLLIGTNKRGQSVSVIDIASGRELARLPTRRRIVHGVVVSPDDRYAFVSVEGIGSEPGTVEIIDLATLTTVATVDVGQMAGGIDFWRTEPAR
ncbi:MAG: YncE family protein [Gemmatimonadaceae bacterium]